MNTIPDSTPEEIERALTCAACPIAAACACMGNAPGEPYCRCQMRTVVRWKGAWIKLQSLTEVIREEEIERGIERPNAVYLRDYPRNQKIQIISLLRRAVQDNASYISLTEAKERVERMGLFMNNLWPDKAREIAAKLEELGAEVELRHNEYR